MHSFLKQLGHPYWSTLILYVSINCFASLLRHERVKLLHALVHQDLNRFQNLGAGHDVFGFGRMALAGGAGSKQGTGGMRTKLEAAAKCLDHGISMVIANGARPDNLYDILDAKAVGTLFQARKC